MAWPRAIALGAVVSMSALAGHAFAGGHSPGGAATALVIIASVLAARFLLAAPGSAWRTASFLFAAQLVAHIASGPMGHTGGHSHMSVAKTAHDHGDGLRRSVAPLAPVLADWVAGGLREALLQPQMLSAHLAAAVIAAVWLARGEQVALTTLGLLWARVIPARHPASPAHYAAPAVAPVPPGPPARLSRYRATALARRGPPVGLGNPLAV